MIQDIGKYRYRNEYRPVKPQEDSRVLCYRRRELFVRCKEEEISFLAYGEVIKKFPCLEGKATYLFAIDGIAFFLFRELEIENTQIFECEQTSALQQDRQYASGMTRDCFEPDDFPGFSWKNIEILRRANPKDAAFAGITGFQIASWYRTRKFCPCCGSPMVHDSKERMMRCTSCGQMEFPKICPAVIVGVKNGDRLLLTKYADRDYKKYALIAGFAEVGETIEETVEREVMEEVGLRVKNLRYYKSQPWSFSDTLLMGFFAEVDGDHTITLDGNELSEGRWCTRDEIPEDDGISLTREMMQVFKRGEV